MIREKTQKELVIDLTGPDGNAFALMAYATVSYTHLTLPTKRIV